MKLESEESEGRFIIGDNDGPKQDTNAPVTGITCE